METQIAGSIARMDGSTSQDAIFKDVLAYKEVLAHIMKTCVPEYKDCTIPQIIGYIEPNPQVGQVGLHPDETNPPKIQGMSTESTTTTEERVVYDVRFSAVAPGEDGKIGLIINKVQSKKSVGLGTDELEETFINPLTNKPYPCIALIKDTNDIRRASNNGEPLVYSPNNDFTKSIGKIVSQIVDEEHALEQPEKKGLFARLFGKRG